MSGCKQQRQAKANLKLRNPKQARMLQTEMLQTDGSAGGSVSDIWISCFEFVSDFVPRISDFRRDRNKHEGKGRTAKHEIRIAKSETSTKARNPNLETDLAHWDFGISDLSRISCFGFRISDAAACDAGDSGR
jgi:hypothetical protein